jgi:hypothetical protein
MSGFHVLRSSAFRFVDPHPVERDSPGAEATAAQERTSRVNRRAAASAASRSGVVIPDRVWKTKIAHRRCDEMAQQIKHQIRHILTSVAAFRLLCESGSEPNGMADVLEAVIRCCRDGFELVAKMRAERSHAEQLLIDDESRCALDLEALLRALRGGSFLPAHELAHAMDPLIVQCVRMDAAAGDARRVRRRSGTGTAG